MSWTPAHSVLTLLARVPSSSVQHRLQPCVQNLTPPQKKTQAAWFWACTALHTYYSQELYRRALLAGAQATILPTP